MEKQIGVFLNNLNRQNYSENTRIAYAADLNQFLSFLLFKFERKPKLVDICPAVINEYWGYIHGLGLKNSTIYRKASTLRTLFNYFEESDLLRDQKEWDQISWPESCNVSKHADLDYLNAFEIKELIALVEGQENPRAYRDLVIIYILLETGLNISNLIGLNVGDWHNRSNKLKLPTGDDLFFKDREAKALMNYLGFGRPELTQNQDEKALFVSQWGRRITRQGVWQMLKNYGEETKLSSPLSPRTLRHTSVQKLIKEGKTEEEIQVKLGHKNCMTTQSLIRRIDLSIEGEHKRGTDGKLSNN